MKRLPHHSFICQPRALWSYIALLQKYQSLRLLSAQNYLFLYYTDQMTTAAPQNAEVWDLYMYVYTYTCVLALTQKYSPYELVFRNDNNTNTVIAHLQKGRNTTEERNTKFWLLLIKLETWSFPIMLPSAFSFSVSTQYYIHELPDYACCIPHYIRLEECEKPITNNQFIVWVHTQIPQNFLPF